MSTITFAKMVATGNDFILVDNRGGKIEKIVGEMSRFANRVCARRESIGGDGLLLLENAKESDITMRIFNPDGGEVTMCGNGSRCVALYAFLKHITKRNMTISTKAGILKVHVGNNAVKVQMTEPKDIKSRFWITVTGWAFEAAFIDTGVPHVVHFVDDIQGVDVKRLGRKIRFHDEFAPEGTNVNFVKVDAKHHITVRTYERGVEDETYACGTGAVASAILASELHSVQSPVRVRTSGGEILTIYFKRRKNRFRDVYLEGGVKMVYEGRIDYV